MSRPAQLPVKIVTSDSQASLIFDPMRREILRLLSRGAHTAKDLSDTIGLTPPSIGHHLKALLKGELISILREEPESHGIVQKWYQANAQAFIVDREKLSRAIRRYYVPIDMEGARMVSACLSIVRNNVRPSTAFTESLMNQICKSICKAAHGFNSQPESDPEHVIHRLYVEALRPMMTEY